MSLISACVLAAAKYKSTLFVSSIKPRPLPPLQNQIFQIPVQWSYVRFDQMNSVGKTGVPTACSIANHEN